MRLSVFIGLLLVSILAVGVWSYVQGAGFGSIIIRVAATAVFLQVGYFVFLVGSGLRSGRSERQKQGSKTGRLMSKSSTVDVANSKQKLSDQAR